ncbi:MAG: helix-turn-helix transcriptional regulator [bacterium]|nr:helix-turn-helix transcriptional regulator [bacterium]
MPLDVDIRIGKRLKQVRTHLGLNQIKFGDRSYIDRTFVNRIENEKQNPSFDFLMKVYDAFDISADWLLFGKGYMFTIPEDHFLNNLDPEKMELLKALNALSEEKQQHLVKAFTEIVLSPD